MQRDYPDERALASIPNVDHTARPSPMSERIPAARRAHHYLHALEVRAQLVSELLRARRDGVQIPSSAFRDVWRTPAAVEPMIVFLRFLNPHEPVMLLDVGANTGYWSAQFRAWFPNSRIHAFEPVAATYALLAQRFKNDSNLTTHNVGLSDKPGTLTMHVGANTRMSSLHEYDASVVQGETRMVASETIRVDTLDNQQLPTSGMRVALKVDVQGHELEVFRGAHRTLAKTDVVLAELTFVSEYQGRGPTFAAVCAMLAEHSLHPVVFCDYGRQASPYGVQRDVFFAKEHLIKNVLGW